MNIELRVLYYFLTVCREGSITRAAEALHLSQPTLSRQLRDMERRLGKQLMVRGSRQITLTDEGMLLRKRAAEILELVDRTESEIALSGDTVSGDVYIGAGETHLMHFLTRAMATLRKTYPDVRFHISSGDTADVYDDLDKGLTDFALAFAIPDESKYEHIQIPGSNGWGVYLRRDNPLARRSSLTAQDLHDQPLIVSRSVLGSRQAAAWMHHEGLPRDGSHVVATYNLVYNATMMVRDGLGCALTFDKLINTENDPDICFIPLADSGKDKASIVWKKYQVRTKAAEVYLDVLKDQLKQD